MRVTLDLELKDVPGQLVMALTPISEYEGNIISIVHHHGDKTPRGTIPVSITFEIVKENLPKLIAKLEKLGVLIKRVGEERLIESISVILIGHIVHSDLRDTIDRIDSTGFAEVVDLAMSMPGVDKTSSARITINATGREELKKALRLLRDIAREKDLLVIEPISIEGSL
ncbi:MAG: amino acid-binding protein [Methanocellales archaeon]